MNKYLDIFNLALEAYKSQNQRPGYIAGWLSSWRHSFSLYPHIEKLQKALTAEENDIEAMVILATYFQDQKTTFHNHSFGRYLLDALEIACRDENWQAYDPQPLIFYQPTEDARLYRGTTLPPQTAFKNGLIDATPKNKIEHYAATSNLSTGISTTKQYKIAESYASSAWIFPTAKGIVFRAHAPAYIYEINYRDGLGVDILETTNMRQSNFIEKKDAGCKEEVNIAGKIAPEDIIGAWEILPKSKKRIENPYYQPNKKPLTLTTTEKRWLIFSLR